MNKLSKGIRILNKILRHAEDSFNDRDMTRFLHYAFRYTQVRIAVYPDTKLWGPGDVLNDIIEKQVFESRY